MLKPLTTPIEPFKMVFLVVYLLTACLSNFAALAYIHDFVQRSSPLPDIVFTFIPQQDWALKVGDTMVSLCVAMLFTLLFFHQHPIILIRRVFFIFGTLYGLRAITLFVTQLPIGFVRADGKCRPAEENPTLTTFVNRVAEQMFKAGLQSNDGQLCGDLLYSGHTLLMVTCTHFIHYYLPKRQKIFALVPAVCALVGVICMILNRAHYTVDCLVALWMASGVFSLYHAYVELDVHWEREKSVLNTIPLMRIVKWLEANIDSFDFENTLRVPFVHYFQRSSVSSSFISYTKQVESNSSSSPSPIFLRREF